MGPGSSAMVGIWSGKRMGSSLKVLDKIAKKNYRFLSSSF